LVMEVVELVTTDREVRKMRERQTASGLFLRLSLGVADVLAFTHENRIDDTRGVQRIVEVARGMRKTDAVVGHLQTLVEVHLTPRPDAAVAVLVGGEVLVDVFHLRTVRVSG